MLRSAVWKVAGLACRTSPSGVPQVAACQRPMPYFTFKPVTNPTSEQMKDYSLPNSSWSQDMMTLFNKFMEMSRDGTWERLPSYRNFVAHMPEKMRKEHKEKMKRETRLFLRNTDTEGQGFEYAMFVNRSEKRAVCVFQLGPYLEGPPGCAHGGSIATILDSTFGGCAIFFGGQVLTANLTVNFNNPILLGSVVLVDTKLDKMEGRKMYVSGQVWSADRKILHSEATALFIQLVSEKPAPQPECSQNTPSKHS